MRTWLVAAMVLGACKAKPLQWTPQVLTKVDLAPFSFDIPPGWRDISESADPELAHITRSLGAEAHLIVRATDTNTDTNIAFMWADSGTSVTCDSLVDAMASMGGDIDRASLVAEQFGTDTGCSFHFKDDKEVGMSWIRMRGARFFTLQCLHGKSGDADADATCTRLAAALKAQ
jgi:hypothetical protein